MGWTSTWAVHRPWSGPRAPVSPSMNEKPEPARTTNPIEATVATARLRQRVTKGPGSRAAGIAMASKLIEPAQHRWRAVNTAHLVALVRAGANVLVERPDESASGDTHAA